MCRILRERIDAVQEILADESPKLTLLRESLKRLPDLARGLCRIQYGKVCLSHSATRCIVPNKTTWFRFRAISARLRNWRSCFLRSVGLRLRSSQSRAPKMRPSGHLYSMILLLPCPGYGNL